MPVSTKERQHIEAVLSSTCSDSICPVKDIMASFGDKWSMYTVLLLGLRQRMRFNELRTTITGISQRMLTVTLRSLEEDGFVSRNLYPEIPPRVEYELTPLGEGLFQQLLQLAKWAEAHVDQVMESRKLYAQRELEAHH